MITLTTDFGYSDHYVGAMKGVILSIDPNVRIVDITHGVRRHDIRHAAYVLRSVVDYFPEHTVHLFVVDPGVGTSRNGIVARLERGYFVGPDNGILTLISERVKRVWRINIKPQSATFHGRDVFAPAAARVHSGDFSELEDIGYFEKFDMINPELQDKTLVGEILHIDHFGNVITNIPASMVPSFSQAEVFGVSVPYVETYANVPQGEAALLINSENYLELSINQGSAAKKFGVQVGDKIKIQIKR
ncbi:MAG: SAM-dependent chlorinase/fluorinase [Euryarchaeota archaeon]|nr:SAM-dependent chlorinase/fluorinase [Euryarchaeota archaeon]